MAIRVLIAGAAGRMGREVAKAVEDHPELILVGGFEHPAHPTVGQDIGILSVGKHLECPVAPSFEDAFERAGGQVHVVIDFTMAGATIANLPSYMELGMALVIGSTGFNQEHKEMIAELSLQNPIMMAPNMSVGVNVFYRLAAQAAEMMGSGYDIEVVEAHHNDKEDSPSGTAVALAGALAEARGWELPKVGRYERHGLIGKRPTEEIGIQAIRAGDIVGDHTVIIAGQGERLELTHRAHSRANFASGAARAAVWIAEKSTGLYNMQDVLGLK